MKKDGKEIFYICDMSPEHLYYNILYHITTDTHSTDEERESAIRNLIFRSIRRWDQNSNP